MAKTAAPKQSKPKTIMLTDDDHRVIEKIRGRFQLQGMSTAQVIRVAMRRLLEEVKAA